MRSFCLIVLAGCVHHLAAPVQNPGVDKPVYTPEHYSQRVSLVCEDGFVDMSGTQFPIAESYQFDEPRSMMYLVEIAGDRLLIQCYMNPGCTPNATKSCVDFTKCCDHGAK